MQLFRPPAAAPPYPVALARARSKPPAAPGNGTFRRAKSQTEIAGPAKTPPGDGQNVFLLQFLDEGYVVGQRRPGEKVKRPFGLEKFIARLSQDPGKKLPTSGIRGYVHRDFAQCGDNPLHQSRGIDIPQDPVGQNHAGRKFGPPRSPGD